MTVTWNRTIRGVLRPMSYLDNLDSPAMRRRSVFWDEPYARFWMTSTSSLSRHARRRCRRDSMTYHPGHGPDAWRNERSPLDHAEHLDDPCAKLWIAASMCDTSSGLTLDERRHRAVRWATEPFSPPDGVAA